MHNHGACALSLQPFKCLALYSEEQCPFSRRNVVKDMEVNVHPYIHSNHFNQKFGVLIGKDQKHTGRTNQI